MRITSLALVLLVTAACQEGEKGDKGDPGDTGPAGDPGPSGPTMVLSTRAKHGLDISPVTVALDGKTAAEVEKIGQGSYLVNAVAGCNDCHLTAQPAGPPKFLSGGRAFPLGAGNQVYARNLTPHQGTGMALTEAEFVEAMRTGKDFRYAGQQLIVMPWFGYRWMSTADLQAIYAYLEALPPVENPIPDDIKGPAAGAPPIPMPASYDEGDVARALPPESAADPESVLRGLAIQPLAQPAAIATASPDVQAMFGRGSYLVNAVANCNDCHGNPFRNLAPGPGYLKINTAGYLTGGRIFSFPPPVMAMNRVARTMSANLVGDVHGADLAFSTFLAKITQGVHVDRAGTPPLGFPMPWQNYSKMTLEDLIAIDVYLSRLPLRTGVNDKRTQLPAWYCDANIACPEAGQVCDLAKNECHGEDCANELDCGACQTCNASNKCALPAADSTCVASGL